VEARHSARPTAASLGRSSGRAKPPACRAELPTTSGRLFYCAVAAARNRRRRRLPNPQPADFVHPASKVFDEIPEGKKTMKLEVFSLGMESSLTVIFRIVDELV